MILLQNVPFERQTQFLLDNICGFPEALTCGTVPTLEGTDPIEGLRAFRTWLSRAYTDTDIVEGESDNARYKALMATIAFLYAVVAHGTSSDLKGQWGVVVDKTTLQAAFRKGRLATRIAHLEHLGFAVWLMDASGDRVPLSRAAALGLTFAEHRDLVAATKAFVDAIEALPDDPRERQADNLGVFIRGDYATAFLGQSIPRSTIDPFRNDIVATVGSYRDDWLRLAHRLVDDHGLVASGFLFYIAVPAWGVSFSEKGRRPLAIFTLGSDQVFVEFTVPVDAVEPVIRARQTYADSIRQGIEAFGCVRCPKACKGANLTRIDGVWVCNGRAEARRIYVTLRTPAEYASIHAMLDAIYG